MRLIKHLLRLTRFDMNRIDEAINYVDQHYQKDLNSEDLAQEVGLSKKKVEVGILKKTGFPTHTYLLMVRVEKSKPLLKENLLQIQEIAIVVGFKYPSHYGEIFKKITRLTPGEYRDKYTG